MAEEPGAGVPDPLVQLALPRGAARGELRLVEQVERRDVPAADLHERLLARDRAALAQADEPHIVEARAEQLTFERLAVGEPRPVDPLDRRKELVQPIAGEVRRVEGREYRAFADAPKLR